MAKALKVKSKKGAPKSDEANNPKKAKKVFAVNEVAQFKGYSRDVEDPLFEAGTNVLIVGKEKRDGVMYYACIPADKAEEYEADKESVSGEELLIKELRKIKQRTPKEPKLNKFEEEAKQFRAVGTLAKYVREGKTVDGQVEVAKKLYDDHNKTGFYLGGMLAHLYYGINGQSYRELGEQYRDEKNGWDTFCNDQFGFSARKGRAFVSIYMQFSRLPNLDVKRLESVGWSKLDIIAPSVTEQNAEELLSEAENKTVNELRDTIRTQYSAGSDDKRRTRERVVRVSCGPYRLDGDQGQFVKDVFKAAAKELGMEDHNQLFYHIVTSWASENINAAKIKKSASKALERSREKEAA